MEQVEKELEKFVPEEKTASEDRLVMLCDGVFAIAMTLLVLDIGSNFSQDLSKGMSYALYNLISPTISYLVTFLVIAAYWRGHRNLMRIVQRLDNGFISLTFLFLAFIAFFPVTSRLLGNYADSSQIIIIYTLGLSGCSFSAFALWVYATWKHRLVSPTLSKSEIHTRAYTLLIIPLIYCASLLLLFVTPPGQPYYVCFSWALIGFVGKFVRTVYKLWLEKPVQALIHHVQEDKLPGSPEVNEAEHTVQEPGQTLIPLPLERESQPLAAPVAQARQEVVEQTHIQEET